MSEQTSENGALTVDAAIASLLPPEPAENPAPEAPVEAAAEPEEIDAGDQPAETPEAVAETDAEGEKEPEPEPVVALDPPLYWSTDAKAKFAELPPELQAVVLEQEGPREAATAKAKADAAEKTRLADAEVGKVAQLAEALADRLPQWIDTFQSRWGTKPPDWMAYAQEHGSDAMVLLKTQFEQEQAQLSEAVQAKQIAETQARAAFVKAEFAKLETLAPELAHPETGPAKRTEVSTYLVKQGIDPDAIQNISAVEMTLARKAMLYDQAQAALKAKPAKPPAAPVAKSPVRPAAASAQSSPQRAAQAVHNRFAQTRSVDDAVALLLASKG